MEGYRGRRTASILRCQRRPVELVPRGARETRDDVHGHAPRRTRIDELAHRVDGGSGSLRALGESRGADHDGHLALDRLAKAVCEVGSGAPDDLLEALRQLAADGDLPRRTYPRELLEGAPQPPRRFERDRGVVPRAGVVPQGAQLRLAPRQVAEEAVLRCDETACDERGLHGARAREHGDWQVGGERGYDEAASRVVHPREPRVGDEREHLAREESRQQLLCPRSLVVAMEADEAASPDLVPVEQDLRAAGVLAEHGVRLAKRSEDAQRDILEVADRGRADDERHQAHGAGRRTGLPFSVERLEPDQAGADEPGVVAELGRDDPQRLVGRAQRLAPGRGKRRLVQKLPRCRSEATADDDHLRDEDVHERADADTEVVPDPLDRSTRPMLARERLLDEAMRVGLPPDGACCPFRCLPRGQRLEVPAPVAVPLAAWAIRLDDDVAQLGPASVQAPVEHDSAADTGPEREREHVGGSPPRTEPPLGERRRVAVVLEPDRQSKPLAQAGPEVEVGEREVVRAQRDPRRTVDRHGDTDPDRSRTVLEQPLDHGVELAEEGVGPVGRCGDLDRPPDRAVALERAAEDLRPADVHSDDPVRRHDAATIPRLMPDQDKPYRVYRGGRAKGRVPLTRHEAKGRADASERPKQGSRKRRRPGRWIVLALVLLLILLVAWGVGSYLAIASGVEEANARVPAGVRRQLTKTDGLLVSKPTTILVLGSDGGNRAGREDANRSDSIMLLRTDPGKRRLSYLSIPRDLQVEIPDVGFSKINAANQIGGPALALRTVEGLTGLDVNHVAFVDFDRFEELIDAVGGIEVNVPRRIRSNKFDCPYKTAARCNSWPGWRFARGVQEMDGRRALVYSRIRENLLNPRETDFDRARRQQQVISATLDKLTSLGTAVKLPFVGDDLVAPLATDLGAWELMQLGWTYFRADTGKALHCRLGGDPATVGGESVILGTEDNLATVAMFTGRSAPQPPPRGLPYAPGCLVGDRRA